MKPQKSAPKAVQRSYLITPHLEKSLNRLLASEAVLYFKTKKAHWLASGPNFKEVHEMLDAQATFILASIDEFAERVTMLGGLPSGGLSEFLSSSMMKDFESSERKISRFLPALLSDHATLILAMRDAIELATSENDPGTADLLTRLVQEHEKAAWFLRETVSQD